MKSIYLSLFFLFFSCSLFAQGQMGFGGQFSSPTGKLKAADYRQGGGFWMEFMSPEIPTRMPMGLQVGMQMDFSFNGSYTEQIEVQYPRPALGELMISNESLGLSAIARFITPDALLRFYIDGRLGSRLMMSNEMVMVDDHGAFDESGCEITSITKAWTFAYGSSLGTQIRISPNMRLDLKATYTQGTAASFVDLSSVRPLEKAQTAYNLDHAPSTGMWLLQAGINMTFSGCPMFSGCSQAPRNRPPADRDFNGKTPGY